MSHVKDSYTQDSSFVLKIPIRNIWVLMFYASDLAQFNEHSRYSFEDAPEDLAQLIAEILCHAVEKRIRRSLTTGFKSKSSTLNRLRGKVEFLETERKQLRLKGKIACTYDDLSKDTPNNRYIKGALEILPKLLGPSSLSDRCRKNARTLFRLGVIGPAPIYHRSYHSSRNDCQDAFALSAARLAYEMRIPSTDDGVMALPNSSHNIRWLRNLFEKAILGFYSVTLSEKDWTVGGGKRFYWQVEHASSGIDEILPSMQTDILIESKPKYRRIVIDTKFNSIFTSSQYRDHSIRSGYLYQIYAYLQSQIGLGEQVNSTGILLHPSLGESVNESVIIQGHTIRFATVDLMADTKCIRKRLLEVIGLL